MQKLAQAESVEAREWAVMFDFDKNSCFPSTALSRTGEPNPGLKTVGSIAGDCRNPNQLDNANTYYRTLSIIDRGNRFTVHMYALYFMKDQMIPGADIIGHRHAWEYALVWVKNSTLTHASYSAHGKVHTHEANKLYFDSDAQNHVKIVYHKDGMSTHAFRFAQKNEKAKNPKKTWITPTIVDWDLMQGDSGITNEKLKQKFNENRYGRAQCPFNDNNFPKEISKAPPADYPSVNRWKNEALSAI